MLRALRFGQGNNISAINVRIALTLSFLVFICTYSHCYWSMFNAFEGEIQALMGRRMSQVYCHNVVFKNTVTLDQ